MKVYSLYWKNIDLEILLIQKKVFDFLKIPLNQILADKVPHGIWMDDIVKSAQDNDTLVFVDIDAFPLTKLAFDEAIISAENGEIFGLAQSANHVESKGIIYAGPMFLAFKKKTWLDLNRPSLNSTYNYDAAQYLTVCANEKNIPVNIIYPNACIKPKWALANKGVFGIGTFYANNFFHLFESREMVYKELLKIVSDDVVNRMPLDFEKYLQVMRKQSYFSVIHKFCNTFYIKARNYCSRPHCILD